MDLLQHRGRASMICQAEQAADLADGRLHETFRGTGHDTCSHVMKAIIVQWRTRELSYLG